ncbi:unnamed protein product, partial [marine sediment metagenome]
DKEIFPRFRRNSALRRSGCVDVLDKLHQWLYGFILLRLDNLRLRLRGISMRRR